MDTRLRLTDPSLERQRTDVPQALMEPLAVIVFLNERKDLPARLVPRVIGLVMDEFILQGTEETFGHRIVIAIAFRLMLGVIPSTASWC